MKVIVFGGAGYIGATTSRLFAEANHEVVIVDDLSTGHESFISGLHLVRADILDKEKISKIIHGEQPDVVLHFAAKIQVAESMQKPADYFENNFMGAINVIDAAIENRVLNFVLSSTAAVYGEPKRIPIHEDDPKHPINPYGLSKYMVEQALHSYELTRKLNWTAFRYFNAAGAYQGIAMDYPIMTHLIPHATEAVLENRSFKLFGDDYSTEDGSCIRDFVHVVDIANAHVMAAEKMFVGESIRQPINLGSGSGYSVKQLITAMEKVVGHPIEYQVEPRRPGDPAVLIADSSRAKELLGWKPELSLSDMVKSHWEWRLKKIDAKD